MSAQILVVDDDEVVRPIIYFQLKRLGFEGLAATNGCQAVELVRQRSFQLILMDVQMPFMDGLEACQAIRELELEQERPRTPIIAITANPDRELCFRAGMDDFLFKPIMLEELRAALGRWLQLVEVAKWR